MDPIYKPKAIIIVLIILAIVFGWLAFSEEDEAKECVDFNKLFVGEAKLIVIPVETRTVVLTAYSSSVDETDSTPFITASGERTRTGIVANNCLPFGSVVKYEGEFYTIQDRMNKKYGCEYFDIWLSSKQLALEFGRQKGIITIYE